ncbi:hypothetical protein BH09PSE2_BH09PSE2_13190 [soil metagenome]
MLTALRRVRRGAWVAIGFVLIAFGVVSVWIPFTLHIGGAFVVIGLIMVLRNSRRLRRHFVIWSRRHPRWGWPLRRLLRKKNPQVWPVLWHEALRMERILPRRLRYLRLLRVRLFRRSPARRFAGA